MKFHMLLLILRWLFFQNHTIPNYCTSKQKWPTELPIIYFLLTKKLLFYRSSSYAGIEAHFSIEVKKHRATTIKQTGAGPWLELLDCIAKRLSNRHSC